MQLLTCPVPLVRSRDHCVSHTERGWRSGELTRLFRGVYAHTDEWRALPPWTKHLVKVHAALAAQPNRLIAGESAAALYGAGIAYASRPVQVLSDDGTSREYGGIRVRASADRDGITVVDGIRITTAARTAVDIARQRPPAEGLAYADALMRIDETITAEQLRAINQHHASGRGRRHATWALDRASGIPETVLESASVAVIEWLGYEPPLLQQTFRFEGEEDRVDTFWPNEQVIGEADGDVKYTGELGDPGQAIIREKRREGRLRRNSSALARWDWGQIYEYERLDATLRAAGLRPVRARDTLRLSTLCPFGR